MKKYLSLIRAKHWLKNIVIFLPMFFSKNLTNYNYLKLSFIAYIIFCLSSSIIYIINDLNDINKDKLHPLKKERPIASEQVSKKEAKIIIVLFLIILSILLIYLYSKVNINLVIVLPILYIVTNIIYSFGLKNIPIVDVSIIVFGFILRLMYGGIVTGIVISKYLYLIIIFGSFFLGFGKRRNEIINIGTKTRKCLKYYNKSFLEKNMYVSLSLAVVFYTLWSIDKNTIQRAGNNYLFCTIPLIIIILQLYSLNIEKNANGDPIEVLFSDKKLLLMCIFYTITMFILLYII